jgi:hypothetical protein
LEDGLLEGGGHAVIDDLEEAGIDAGFADLIDDYVDNGRRIPILVSTIDSAESLVLGAVGSRATHAPKLL